MGKPPGPEIEHPPGESHKATRRTSHSAHVVGSSPSQMRARDQLRSTRFSYVRDVRITPTPANSVPEHHGLASQSSVFSCQRRRVELTGGPMITMQR